MSAQTEKKFMFESCAHLPQSPRLHGEHEMQGWGKAEPCSVGMPKFEDIFYWFNWEY